MAEQSHRDEMNAAIRAQRERHAAPRTIAPPDEAPPVAEPDAPAPPADELTELPEPQPVAPRRRSIRDRLRGR